MGMFQPQSQTPSPSHHRRPPPDLLKLIYLGSRFEPVGKPASGLLLKGLLFNIVFGAYSARKTQMKSYSIFASPHFLLLFLPLSSHFTPQLACAMIATTYLAALPHHLIGCLLILDLIGIKAEF